MPYLPWRRVQLKRKIVLKQIHKEAATTDFGDKQIAPILRLRLRIFSKTDEFPFGCVGMAAIHV